MWLLTYIPEMGINKVEFLFNDHIQLEIYVDNNKIYNYSTRFINICKS